MSWFSSAIAAIYIFLLITAAVSDFRYLRIPNWISIALIVLFFFYAWTSAISLPIVEHVGVASGAFAITLVLYVLRWFSAGDVKLITAVALWAGPSQVLPFALVTAMIGGAFGLGILLMRKVSQLGLPGLVQTLTDRLPRWSRHGLIPYGLAIVGGGLWLVPFRF